MESTIQEKIIEALARDTAIENLEKVAYRVRALHFNMVQTLSAFVGLCLALEEFRTDFGEDVYQLTLEVLGLKSDVVKMVRSYIVRASTMPESGYRHTLRSIAWNTVKSMGLLGGGNGHNLG